MSQDPLRCNCCIGSREIHSSCTVIAVVWLGDMYINYSLPQALIFRPLSSSFACLLSGWLCILSTYGINFFQSWIFIHLLISFPNVSSCVKWLSNFILFVGLFCTSLVFSLSLTPLPFLSPSPPQPALQFFAFLCVLICPSLRGISFENKVTY